MSNVDDLYFLPEIILDAIKCLNFNNIYEIRLRVNQPILVNLCGEYNALLLDDKQLIFKQSQMEYVLSKVTEYSIYAFNEEIKKGFITTKSGIRIGLAGDCVYEKNSILTIKNISSLNVRVPHEILGSSDKVFSNIYNNNKIYNTLILSPPGFGKTTILKDLIRKFNSINKQVLVIDERGELFIQSLLNVDYIRFCDKNHALTIGIRSLSPEVVICDELVIKEDWQLSENAISSGVKLVSTVHAESISDLKKKKNFIYNIFERYAVIKDYKNKGIIDIYNEEFIKL